MIVYHGSTEIVRLPDVMHSYRSLDFGKGFYVTTIPEQAERWAKRKADLIGTENAFINIYRMSEQLDAFNVRAFGDDLSEWIDFVCSCRGDGTEYLKYDLITGRVANDQVYRVVDMYRSGIWDKERAIREMRAYKNYDQTAFITQRAVDCLLSFEEYRRLI